MMRISGLVLLCCIYLAACAEQPYDLVIHNFDPEAKCLDGTSPALYIHEGGDTNNFLIHFEGGGFCSGSSIQQVIESCYQRSKTDLGSSKNYPKQLIGPGGYLSTDPQQSRFANWTKIVIRYCDGGQHQGYGKDPIQYKDAKLYLRGSTNTRSHLHWLQQKYKFNAAQRVVFTGASAGGIATFTWSNYIRNMMDNPSNLYTIADSAIYANVSFPGTNTHIFDIVGSNLFKVTNIDEKFPIEACNQKYPGEEYKCVFVQNSYEFLDSQIMFINSQYDVIGMEISMNMKCMTNGKSGKTLQNCSDQQMKSIEGYRGQFMNIAQTLVDHGHSVWSISCSTHSYACYKNFYNVSAQKVPQIVGDTVADAIDKFVFQGKKVVDLDQVGWPNNQPCAY